MGQVLHRSATTTEAIRRAIQRYGLNSKAGAPADAQSGLQQAKNSKTRTKTQQGRPSCLKASIGKLTKPHTFVKRLQSLVPRL